MKNYYFLAVDVGTGSVRAALFNCKGHCIALNEKNIKTWNYNDNYYEQSSNNIWESVLFTLKNVLSQAKTKNIALNDIKSINFDATCSLVALDDKYLPVSVNTDLVQDQNIILWMDHRATAQADKINQTNHDVLQYVGGKVSPEMQIPKILWLKEQHRQQYDQVAHFVGLPDFLTFKATNKMTRSICSLVCKWNFLGKERCFDDSYFNLIGLNDIVDNKYQTIFTTVNDIGTVVGNISSELAQNLNLPSDCIVLTSQIDAHCGGIGILGAREVTAKTVDQKIAIIAGTSSCHMVCNLEKHICPGVWGPYYGAMLPNFYLHEGGQSTSGAGIDYIIQCHPAYSQAKVAAEKLKIPVPIYLNQIILEQKWTDEICRDIHVLPYLLGNRSPISDNKLKGLVYGYNGSFSLLHLAKLYYATVLAVGYGTKHIISRLNDNGYHINEIIMTGGLAKNALFVQTHANCTNLPVYILTEENAVLLGGAILGAYATKSYDNLFDAMHSMNEIKQKYLPTDKLKDFHTKKYQAYIKLGKTMQEINAFMV